jgi:hypothetical protein
MSRSDRRKAARDALKLARARLRLAALEPGGAPEHPIDVVSASTIEPRAASMPCAACGAPGVRVEEHEAPPLPAQRGLRVVRVICAQCAVRREIWFRIGTALPS